MLDSIIKRAKEDDQVEGLIPHLVDGGVSIPQYADDATIFMKKLRKRVKNEDNFFYEIRYKNKFPQDRDLLPS
jgi:hypothetical protein